MRTHLQTIIFSALVSAAFAVGAQNESRKEDSVFQCTDVNGNMVYSSQPCDQVGRVEMPPLELVEREMNKIDQVDRAMAAIKREISHQRMERESALQTIYRKEGATREELSSQAEQVEKEFDQRIDSLTHELAQLGETRNQLVEESVTVFMNEARR